MLLLGGDWCLQPDMAARHTFWMVEGRWNDEGIHYLKNGW